MKPSKILSLMSDFGLGDPFVGVMHAVILARFPEAKIVDLSHGVAPQAVSEAAFWLAKCYARFPAGTVHVAVVDPGVGTDRAALAVEAGGHAFVAPDNGILGEIALQPGAIVRAIDVGRLGLPDPSKTFHGRDVFAPVGAELASGRLSVSELGQPVTALPLPLRQRARHAEEVTGAVISVDRFGNLITDIEAAEIQGIERPIAEVGGRSVVFADTYGEVPRGEMLALVSSFDTVEIAVREGNAARLLGVERGASVVVRGAKSE